MVWEDDVPSPNWGGVDFLGSSLFFFKFRAGGVYTFIKAKHVGPIYSRAPLKGCHRPNFLHQYR